MIRSDGLFVLGMIPNSDRKLCILKRFKCESVCHDACLLLDSLLGEASLRMVCVFL